MPDKMVQMMFKTCSRRFISIAGILLALIICISCCSMLKGQAIKDSWSDPVVSVSGLKYEWNGNQSHVLVQCAYQLAQTAHLQHSRTVWKSTDWQREITERVNVISSGCLVATVNSDGTTIRPLPFEEMPDRIVNVPWKSGWILSSPEMISFVSLTNVQTLYRAPTKATISVLTLCENETNVTFCITQGWKTECIRLNLNSLVSQVQYAFDASGAHGMRITPDAILYLDPDPRYTVFATEKGTRPHTGILAIGIDTKNNTAIKVFQPKDIAADAQAYEWMLSPNKKSLGLKIQQGSKPESSWISRTGVPPDFQSVGNYEWNDIMAQAKKELPSSITSGIREYLEERLPERPLKNNYYRPLSR